MSSGIVAIPQFVYELMLKNDKTNWASFKIRIEQSATRTGLKGYIDGAITRPPIVILSPGQTEPQTPFYSKAPSRDEWDFRDGCATALVVQNIIDPVAIGLNVEGTSAEIWTRLERLCIPKSDAALSNAENNFNTAAFAGTSTDELDAHWADLNAQVAVLRSLGKTVTDKDLKGVLIRSLPATNPQWLPLIAQLFPYPTAEDVWGAIQTYAATIKLPKAPTGGSTAFAAATGKRHCTNPKCKAKDRSSHWVIDCYWEGGGKEGQFPPGFGQRKKQSQAQANQTSSNTPATTPSTSHVVLAAWTDGVESDSSIIVSIDGEDNSINDPLPSLSPCICPVAYVVDAPVADTATVSRTFEGVKSTISLTFLDSGASDHFFRDRDDFAEYESLPYRTGKSALASEGDFPIVGKGTVTRTYDVEGKKITLTFKNALHAPSLSANLISVSQFDRGGYYSLFGGGRVVITKGLGGTPILHGRGSSGMYVLDSSQSVAMLSTSAPVDLQTWHRRFAHSDVERIREMAAKGLVDDLRITNLTVDGRCPDCQAGRQHTRPYDNHTDPDVPPLGLVAMDLWGPSRTPSVGGNIYMMIIVDSGTSYKYGDFLKDKSDDTTIKAFDDYRVLLEKQTGQQIKRVRTDNAFNSHAWSEYFKTHGIVHETTAPYSSAQNGLAERALRTVLEDVRTGLHDSNLPHKYWAAAAAASIHVRNRMTTRRHPGKIPAEEMLGGRQSVAHFRVWGSRCKAKAPVVNGIRVDGKSKLDDRGISATLIGYGVGAGNYVLVDDRGVQFVSRNVEFDEGYRREGGDEGIFGGGDENELQTPVHTDAFNSVPPKVVAPGDEVKFKSSTSSITSSSSSSGPSANDTPSQPPSQPEPRRSSRTPVPTRAAIENAAYERREDLARAAGEDWATETPAANAAWNASADLDDFVALLGHTDDDTYEPKTYKEAMSLDADRWTAAMDVEMDLHQRKGTWELGIPPPGANVMAGRWVYAVKKNGDGVRMRDKARWVGKGFTQQLGVDYNETWAAVARMESIRMMAAVAVAERLHIWLIDFEAAFLNSDTTEEIWMDQPSGYEVEGREGEKCRLKKTIYGTMQGGHDWAGTLNGTYDELGYTTSRADPCVRVRTGDNGEYTLTATYTDDVMGASASLPEAETRKAEMGRIWDIREVTDQERLLGMTIIEKYEAGTITLSQRAYFEKVFKEFGLENLPLRSIPLPVGTSLSNDMSPTTNEERQVMKDKPYRTLLGKVMWGQLTTRPDLSYAVSVLSRYQTNPGLEHWRALLHVLGYIRQTVKFGLIFSSDQPLVPVGFVDADYAGCKDTRRSTSGQVFMMAGAPVSWSSKRQQTVALSTVESEYVSTSKAGQQMRWMYSWLEEILLAQEKPGDLWGDNRGALDLTKNTKSHAKVKHIDIRHHYIRELVAAKEIKLNFVRGNENPADIFTKPLPRDAHYRCLAALNIGEVDG